MPEQIETFREKYFLTDMRSRLFLIALNLLEDENYSREDAVTDIDAVCKILDEGTPS